jgi:hypothetical protein
LKSSFGQEERITSNENGQFFILQTPIYYTPEESGVVVGRKSDKLVVSADAWSTQEPLPLWLWLVGVNLVEISVSQVAHQLDAVSLLPCIVLTSTHI